MSARQLLALLAVLVTALLLLLGALDVRAWDQAFARGDRNSETRRGSRWVAATRLPGDPAGRALDVAGNFAIRRAVTSFVAADRVKRGFDNGVTRSRLRAHAEAQLTDVAVGARAADASQADVLLGILAAYGGSTSAGETADERARDLFEAAVRLDPRNDAAKRNLELVLRRLRAIATRTGAGNGSGRSGHGRRGAGAGSPGRGY